MPEILYGTSLSECGDRVAAAPGAVSIKRANHVGYRLTRRSASGMQPGNFQHSGASMEIKAKFGPTHDTDFFAEIQSVFDRYQMSRRITPSGISVG